MDQLKQLQHLSLVSKVTTGARLCCADCSNRLKACTLTCSLAAELENNIGISEKTLAEFIIKLSEGRRSVKEFAAVREQVQPAEPPLCA